jgi:hypothetical protein
MVAPEPYAKAVLPVGHGGRTFARPNLPTMLPKAFFFPKASYCYLFSLLTNRSNQTGCAVQWVGAMLACVVTFLLLASTLAFAEAQKLPLVNNKEIVATVDGEPITLEEFNQAIASSHAARPAKTKAGAVDFSPILRRLINTRLIVAEAKSMGLAELPQVRSMVADHSRSTLMELLLEQQVRDVKADENEVEQLYKESVREWKIKSLDFI